MRRHLLRLTSTRATLPIFREARLTRPITTVSNARCSSIWPDALFLNSICRPSFCHRVVRFGPATNSSRKSRGASHRFLQPAAHPSSSPEAIPVGGLTCRVLSPPAFGIGPSRWRAVTVSQAGPYDRTGGSRDEFIVSIVCVNLVHEVERTVDFAASPAGSLDGARRSVDDNQSTIAGSAGRSFKSRSARTGLGARVRRKAVFSGNARDRRSVRCRRVVVADDCVPQATG